MNTSCFLGVAGVVLHFFTFSHALGQTSGPEFLNCENLPVSLCINDVGIRLPDSNQIFFDQNTPGTTSCSVHMTRYKDLKSTCGAVVQFQAEIFLDDSLTSFILQPWTFIQLDSAGTGQLFLNTESAPDSLIQVSGISYNSGCMAYHRIRWTAIDSCGQLTTCDELINLYDCQGPISANEPGQLSIVVVTPACFIQLYAKDYIFFPLDDCISENEILFSLRVDTYLPDIIIDPCDIPALGVELSLPIWIADGGNDLDCNGTIDWAERNKHLQNVSIVYVDHGSGTCFDCWTDWVLMGDIETEDHQAVELVYVTASAPNTFFPTYITGKDGRYNFYNIAVPADLTVEAYRNDNHKNGVSTLDLLKIQKHLLGIEPLNSPYDLIAADANNSQSVSAIDLVELRKLILGKYIELPNNTSWRFTPSKYIFPDSLHPFPFPEYIRQSDTTFYNNVDFIGIKIGDVNNTVKAHAQTILPRQDQERMVFELDESEYKVGDVLTIPFRLTTETKLEGLQFTLSCPDLQFVRMESGVIPVTEEDYALFDDRMTLAWFSTQPEWLSANDVLFTIHARALQAGRLRQNLSLNSDITEAEGYAEGDQVFIPALQVKGSEEMVFEFFPAKPNPWETETILPFYTRDPGEVVLHITNIDGKPVLTRFIDAQRGRNEIRLTAEEIQHTGLLICKLIYQDELRTQKITHFSH